jgi:uncharacterized protein
VRNLIAALLLCHACLGGAEVPVEKLHVRVPMRDGIRLDTNIFRPSGTRLPAILLRTPYGKGTELSANNRAFVEHGYAIVIQDVRGRHDSEGVFRPLDQEGPDGEDTIAWVSHQPWCDGKVGMIGGSYLGIVQWQAAVRNPPALKAIFPVVSGYDDYLDRYYSRGGAYKLAHRLLWMSENLRDPDFPKPGLSEIISHIPLRTSDRVATGHTVNWYQKTLDHPAYDSFWRSISTREKLNRMRVPVFAVGGWFDNYGQSDLEAFNMLQHLGRDAHVLIGPWPHNMADRFTSVNFGAAAGVPIRRLQFDWFDHWLKGRDTITGWVPVRYFTMGENRWHYAASWPPPESVVEPMYLASKGHANGAAGDGVLQNRRKRTDQPDEYTYDPRNPAPTRGGAICCNFRLLSPGPMDQRAVEARPDVLVYTSGVLKDDLEITGLVRVLLYASTSAPDTDFTAKLVDVYPDGTAMSITDGILRLRYRGGLDKPELARPGETYGITIDAGTTSIVLPAGHRLRLEISSSNFPRFDRNPNTGRAVAGDTELRPARQIVHHGGLMPSALLLPVVKRK